MPSIDVLIDMFSCQRFSLVFLVISLYACSTKEKPHSVKFKSLLPGETGVDFSNTLTYTESFNAYTYRNFYNGAGVALGDINNDGLLDIYFTGNQVDNRLYLNKGNFKFQDITEAAGVACPNVWSTGVSMVDVNGDGWLDIFVCKSGPPQGGVRHNELFINNGDLTFTESASKWGIADDGLSLQAVFFDYDKDGDLDFYLLNNSNRSVGIFDLREGQRHIRDPFGGNKLYRNEGDHFVDVSEQSGIYGSAIGFGLGVLAADLNHDGWQDIFVSNDFFERDYLYLNNQDGTFSEVLEEVMAEISMGSMGLDIADLNNDGFPEVYVTEMLPDTLPRLKTKSTFEDWNKFSQSVKQGYHRQYSRNALHYHQGLDERGFPRFSEISRYASVAATDWSWSTLIFDADNDGLRDIFVANGIAKDLLDQDYINFTVPEILGKPTLRSDSILLTTLMHSMPENPIQNYFFENNGDFVFEDMSVGSGLTEKTFSNGAAYGDLDNDGRLDLVINNINAKPLLYRNESLLRNYLQVNLIGEHGNTQALGAQLRIYCGANMQYIEQSPVRGYLSSVSPVLHVGLGKFTKVDSIDIQWPDLSHSYLYDISGNQRLTINEQEQKKHLTNPVKMSYSPYLTLVNSGFDYRHRDSSYVEFDRDRLLLEMSQDGGPVASVADLNADGLQDIFIGGTSAQVPKLFFQNDKGEFTSVLWNHQDQCEDRAILCEDLNQDGALDLVLGAGGSQFGTGAYQLRDRIFLNNGSGFFTAGQLLVGKYGHTNTAFIKSLDFNRDGNIDLLIGMRSDPFRYGVPVHAQLFMNLGEAQFKDVTDEYASQFNYLGMLTDAAVFDFDRDGDDDIVFVGDWMPPVIFEFDKGKFNRSQLSDQLISYSGKWNSIQLVDLNRDGFEDLVMGNSGLNVRNKADAQNPWVMYIHDFDQNGNVESICCMRDGKRDYPLIMYPDLTKQIPGIRKNYKSYESYSNASIDELFTERQVNEAITKEVNELRSGVFINHEGSSFEFIPFPWNAQLTKITELLTFDINSDGNIDILWGGNKSKMRPEWGANLATGAGLLVGKGDGTFEYLSPEQSGIWTVGEVREIRSIRVLDKNQILLLLNDNKSLQYEWSDMHKGF